MIVAGKNYTGKNIRVALIDTGIQTSIVQNAVPGWKIGLTQDGGIQSQVSHTDPLGRGTELALCLLGTAPDVTLLGIDIFNAANRTNSELLVAGIEVALQSNVDIICVCVQSFNMDKKHLFESICSKAAQEGVLIVATGYRKKISFPARIDNVLAVDAQPDCQTRNYYYDPLYYPTSDLRNSLFLSNGWWKGRFLGAEVATIHIAAQLACFKSVPDLTNEDIVLLMKKRAFLPFDDFGLC